MSSNKLLELSNLVFSVKEKLTDQEYKNMMDTLGEIHNINVNTININNNDYLHVEEVDENYIHVDELLETLTNVLESNNDTNFLNYLRNDIMEMLNNVGYYDIEFIDERVREILNYEDEKHPNLRDDIINELGNCGFYEESYYHDTIEKINKSDDYDNSEEYRELHDFIQNLYDTNENALKRIYKDVINTNEETKEEETKEEETKEEETKEETKEEMKFTIECYNTMSNNLFKIIDELKRENEKLKLSLK